MVMEGNRSTKHRMNVRMASVLTMLLVETATFSLPLHSLDTVIKSDRFRVAASVHYKADTTPLIGE